MAPALYPSVITHVRSGPRSYALRQRTYLWLVDLDRLPRLPRAIRALARFDARDHFGGDRPTIREGLDRFLAAHGAAPAEGRVLMLAHARVFGYVFNPLSVFWCHGSDGELRHVVAEVHNTYGERHCYLLGPEAATGAGHARKEFYVSPFLPVTGDYLMRLPRPGERLALTVRLDTEGGRRLTATVRGVRRAADPPGVLRAALRRPWSTAAVSLGIRFHGIRLWLRGMPVQPRPRHVPQEGVK
ncbi:DUF1365 domain-containing protein [Streptomyces sp. G-G2]|uniref:DUF1365 domain-containing protein n=1 Tax=Streptomyces sp. G-G2 TaxID=3046201 RepID=UPI0024B895EB|nr:DUF1365 domain-containing protein [Streptomyces sp. G-G2]MDJ0381128.1 DUF1365 domain-containing protein [Streptomyces sp. G-G2]